MIFSGRPEKTNFSGYFLIVFLYSQNQIKISVIYVQGTTSTPASESAEVIWGLSQPG